MQSCFDVVLFILKEVGDNIMWFLGKGEGGEWELEVIPKRKTIIMIGAIFIGQCEILCIY